MLGLPLAFTVPAVLGALALLPALYVLLRVTPPRPRRIPFPPLRLILDLRPREEKPARTPPWLLLLRLAIAAAVILAMAGPIWNPPAHTAGANGPLLVLLDDGFAAAPDWDARVAAVADRLTEAERRGRPTALAPLSEGPREILPMTGTQALDRLRALRPVPYLPDRAAALPAVGTFLDAHRDAEVVWLADGLDNGNGRAFAQGLGALGTGRRPTVLTATAAPPALAGADNRADALSLRVIRADAQAAGVGTLKAYDGKGLELGGARFDFAGGTATEAAFDLPVEIRNAITHVAIDGEASAGAVTLLDGRSKRRRVEIVSGASAEESQPLLNPGFFVARALAPYADVRTVRAGTADPVSAALAEKPSVVVLADVGAVSGEAHDRLADFVDEGGVLLRFAGSRLAGGAADDLEPVTLRRGGRTFGGALSWDKPKAIAPFDRGSPFFGLKPAPDATVSRQVLAEPDAGLAGRTWAHLDDGTPIVTGERRGKGSLVLFHVTADTTWSNLPLSGLFVDMLRRIVALAGESPAGGDKSGAAAGEAEEKAALPPSRILDGFGTLGAPPVSAKPIPASFAGIGSADHPPGFYGTGDALVAVNPLAADAKLVPLDLAGLPVEREILRTAQPVDLRAALVATAFAGFLLDALLTLWLGSGLSAGGWRRGRRDAVAALLLLGLGAALLPQAVRAAGDPPVPRRDIESALTTRLAYVPSGDAAVDQASQLGLKALSRALANRTSLDPGEPVAVDPARDELAFYPMIYWPIVGSAPQPPPEAVAKIAAFMKNGGTVIFDTRDALTSRPDGPPTAEGAWLQRLLAGVDVPELEPVPRDHVITKTFYLIDGFVGRYADGRTWVEALPPAPPDQINRPARSGDSVSPIVITSNDLAAGWAAEPDGTPLYPLVPGGNRQRELAIRGGINLVIYTLTGNYKADQVHVRDLLDRLSH